VAATSSVVDEVRAFVEEEVIPVADELEHADAYPEDLVERMKALGLFGITVPREFGGLELDLESYAAVTAQLSRGWMTLSGILNTHLISAWMIRTHGTEEQRARLLPRMATGELRSAYSMTEPQAGTDVQAIETEARREGDGYALHGRKRWVTNGLRSGLVMLLARTDLTAEPRHRGMTAFLVEKEPGVAELPGLTVPRLIDKLGYRGLDSAQLLLEGYRVGDDAVLGGEAGLGRGFRFFMGGVEIGRVNVAARAVGLAQRAFDESIAYAQRRSTFGQPIAQHQAVQLKLAQMATKIEAARLLTAQAARKKDAGERADLEAGMAKLFATETATEVATEALRIHGGNGYSKEFVVERLYRDAPVLMIGEGSNEIQQVLIARRLLERHAVADPTPIAPFG
jgi:butyryl-CoA dehydrogenase